MDANKDLRTALVAVAKSKNVFETMNHLIHEAGGWWQSESARSGFLKAHYASINGIGPSAEAAVIDWLDQARTRLDMDIDAIMHSKLLGYIASIIKMHRYE